MRQKTLLVVWNAANRGKTETLKKFVELILEQYFSKVSTLSYNKAANNNDFEMLLTIDDNKIGIVSEGDPGTGLKKKLNKLDEDNCNIIICTSRTRGGTVDDVENLSKTKKYKILWSETYQEDGAMKHNDEVINDTNLFKAKHLLLRLQNENLI